MSIIDMCAINPRHKKRILFDFYTSHPLMTKEKFEELVYRKVLQAEQVINTESLSIRVHVKETDQEAD